MINTEDLYKKRTDCCGCEACAQICPKKIIKMESDYDGFLYPVAFNPKECINCKKCLKVCPLKSEFKGDKAKKHIGGHCVDENEIKKSASGGLATILAQKFISRGGIVYGVSYSDDFIEAQYIRCSTIGDIETLRGSKYSQANKKNVFNEIRNDLNTGHEVLFIGLPCEVNALNLFLTCEKSNLYTVSLICHGPTSPLVLKEYVTNLQNTNDKLLKNFTLRAKPHGWKPYFIHADFKDGTSFAEEFHSSTFGIAFKELKRQSCSHCRFKLSYNESRIDADLIIGDFHGVTQDTPQYNKWGVSQASILTEKGDELIHLVETDFEYSEISSRQAIHYNKALSDTIKPRCNRNQFALELSNHGLNKASKLRSILLLDVVDTTKRKILNYLVKTRRLLKLR